MARRERKYHYLYKITSLKNNRYYIGMHSTDNLEDGYFGGGKRIKNSVKKHGKDAHRKEILEFFENRELLRQREIQIVNEDLLKDPLCMNLQPGGGGGFINENHRNKWIINGSSAGNKKQKDLWTYDEEWSRAQSEKRRRYWEDPDISNRMKSGLNWKGRKHSEESKIKMSEKASQRIGGKNSQYGSRWITDGLENKKIKMIDHVPEGWKYGRSHKFLR
jgi:hypothetical protein